MFGQTSVIQPDLSQMVIATQHRQSQSRQSEDDSITATITLVDILLTCPPVLRALHRTTLISLAASCRELRQLVQPCISVITVADMADVDLLLRGRWHNLQLIIMQESPLLFLSMLENRNNFNPPWQLLLCIQSISKAEPAAWDKQNIAMLLRPAHLDRAGYTQHVMQSVDFLLEHGWPRFCKLWLSHTESSEVAEGFLAKLKGAAIW